MTFNEPFVRYKDQNTMTNTLSRDPFQVPVVDKSVFGSLRAKLAHEVSGSAILAELLGKVNQMQECCEKPHEFQQRFDEFVARAADHLHVVRPFFPMLAQFLPLQRAAKLSEPLSFTATEPELSGEVA
jgi:hypothetical protein